MELWDHVSDKLGLKTDQERDCVKNILLNTFLLNETQSSELTESKIDALVKVTGAYVGEVLKVINDPEAYKVKLREMQKRLNEIARDKFEGLMKP